MVHRIRPCGGRSRQDTEFLLVIVVAYTLACGDAASNEDAGGGVSCPETEAPAPPRTPCAPDWAAMAEVASGHAEDAPPELKRLCEEGGGHWGRIGDGTYGSGWDASYCYCPTTDAGRCCTDERTCQGGCLLLEDSLTCEGLRGPGVCSDVTEPVTCRCQYGPFGSTVYCSDPPW